MGHQNIDSRPKRRKAKDNPYTLFTVGLRTGSPQYFVSFQTSSGHSVCLEVEREIFEAMDRFELDDLRYMNEMDNHYERSELTEASLAQRMAHKAESIENTILNRMRGEALKEEISRLPAVQRRRLVLHFYGHFSYREIADMEGCSTVAVKKSIDAAKRKLKKDYLEG